MKAGALLGLLLAVLPLSVAGETATAPTGLADIWPAGAYGAALEATLTMPQDQQDFAALRSVYAASPGYTGASRIGDKALNDFANQQMNQPVEVWAPDDYLAAIFADFPLLDTQIAAISYFKSLGNPKADKMVEAHTGFYQAILQTVLATEDKLEGNRRFKVLSIGEERAVMVALKLKPGTQMLRRIDGVPHDAFETSNGMILFDISAFFGK